MPEFLPIPTARKRSGLLLLLCSALIAGCAQGGAGSMPAVSPNGSSTLSAAARPGALVAAKRHTQSTCPTLYNFKGAPDGSLPEAGLFNLNGTLYGTTATGGTSSLGIVYSIVGGSESVVHSFTGTPDGSSPYAGLIAVGSALYGTTIHGGAHGDGAVFKIAKSGKLSIVYSFNGGPDGAEPAAGVINDGGTLYGTTVDGGATGNGTVFSVTTSGVEKVLYSFANGSDGAGPLASLVRFKGALYGTTQNGGTDSYGTVFSVTTSGKEKESVLHSFAGSDGAGPVAGLAVVNGALYGTTPNGGAIRFDAGGTAFKITAAGKLTVLHSFGYGLDAADPSASLLDVNGTLYGTSAEGGQDGSGAVFSITTSGAESVLCSWPSGNDGEEPMAGLIDVSGTLYGTTQAGGTASQGTVFAVPL